MKFIYTVILISVLICCKDNKTKQSNKDTQKKEISLENKTLQELRILRNEIYAKKGYFFKDPKMFAYFSKYDWYKPMKDKKIILSMDEEIEIKKIKSFENKLKILIDPKGFKIEKESIKKVDFDNDGIEDVIFMATDGIDYQEGGREPIFIYLSSDKKRHMFDLPSFDFNTYEYSEEKNTLTYDATLEGTGRIRNTFTIKYNNSTNKVELIGYSRSSRADISYSKELIFDIKKGEYVMTYYNDEIFKRLVGKENKPIKAEFTSSYYSHLGDVGREFDDY